MFKRAVAFAVVSLVALAAACTQSGGPGGPGGPSGVPSPPFEGDPPEEAYVFKGTPGTYGGTLVFSAISDPKSWNPITSSESSTTSITNGPVYIPIFGFDNIAQHIDDGVTTSHESTPDGLVWTIKLRKGVRWSDGHPFTADDVKFTFDVAFDPNVDNSIKSSFEQTDGSLPVVEVVDPQTVRFTLKEPSALFVDNVGSTYLVPKHKWEAEWKAGNFQRTLGIDTKPEDIVSLGPFRVKEFVTQQRVVLERNPYYWKVDTKGQRLPYLDRVIIQIVPDQNAMLLNFQNGTTDMNYAVRPEDVDLLRREEAAKDFKVYDLGPGFNWIYLLVNQHTGKSETSGKPHVDPAKLVWFRDVRFRQALSYAIDRDSILRTVYQGLGVPVYSFTPPANKVWYDEAAIKKYPFDPARARELLKEMGLEDRNGDGIIEDAKGTPVAFTLNTNSNNPSRIQVCTVIKDNLKAVGIDVNFQPIPFNSMVDMLQKTHEWEAVVGGWQSGNPPDPVLMKNIVLSSGILHYSFPLQKTPSTPWEKQIDDLMAQNQRTIDLTQRKAQLAEVLKIWTENLPEIDLVAPNYFVAVKNKVGNMRPSPLPLYTYWNIEELYLTK
jgi:peptide/nickel transport system substrate-binding protein